MAVSSKEIREQAGEPPKGTKNPWKVESWNLTRQMTFARDYGMDVAREWAAMAGATIGGPKPKPKTPPPGAAGPRGQKGRDGDDLDHSQYLTIGVAFALFG